MDTKSTHTKRARHSRYVPGSSRERHSATTLLSQVADIERGQRIRARREELHLTQPAVVDLLEDAARELPVDHELHPDKAGKAPVTLRGYQTYEQGGGIVWEKAKLLARVLQLDVQAMMNGPSDGERAPSPFAGQDALADRLDRIEATLGELRQEREQGIAEVQAFLRRQDAVLERIEQAITREEQSARRDDESARRLDEAVQRARQLLAGETPDPAEAPARQAK